jgi:hypothetical protein
MHAQSPYDRSRDFYRYARTLDKRGEPLSAALAALYRILAELAQPERAMRESNPGLRIASAFTSPPSLTPTVSPL